VDNNYGAENLTDEAVHYIDKYIKTIIKNTTKDFFRTANKHKKHGLSFVAFENPEEELASEDPGYEEVLMNSIEIKNMNVLISDPDLYAALSRLTDYQRIVLLQNTIMRIPLRIIAAELGISERMAKKHKHNAIERIRKEYRKP